MYADVELMRDTIEMIFRCVKAGSDKYACSSASAMKAIVTMESIIWDAEVSVGTGIIKSRTIS